MSSPSGKVSGDQGALFDVPAKPRRKTWAQRLDDIEPLYAPGEPRPWDVIDDADAKLGWQYRWVTPRRAVEIRLELRGRRA